MTTSAMADALSFRGISPCQTEPEIVSSVPNEISLPTIKDGHKAVYVDGKLCGNVWLDQNQRAESLILKPCFFDLSMNVSTEAYVEKLEAAYKFDLKEGGFHENFQGMSYRSKIGDASIEVFKKVGSRYDGASLLVTSVCSEGKF